MLKFKPLSIIVLVLISLLCLPIILMAQTDNPIILNQPVSGNVTADTPATFTYNLSAASLVSFQVISSSAQPTITVSQNDQIVASEANDSGAFLTTLSTYLDQGVYEVSIGGANQTTGSFVLVVQMEQPVQSIDLVLSTPVTDDVSAQETVVLYKFTALNEPSFVSVTSGLTTGNAQVSLWNDTLKVESGILSSDLLGGTFNIPANGANYRLEITFSNLAPLEPFNLCWFTTGGGCGGDATIPATPVQPTPSTVCTVTPSGSAVNIRSSASTSAPIVGSLKFGETATVIGLSPDGLFHNILLNGLNGWVAASVVVTGGDCSNIPLVTPPNFVPVPTLAPTLAVSATQTPTLMATLAPTAAASNTPSGPCLLTLNSPVKVYTEPIEKVDFLLDQVQSGELIPTGRLADGSWWQTNYGGAWVSTSLIGGALTLSGSCSLPVVNP